MTRLKSNGGNRQADLSWLPAIAGGPPLRSEGNPVVFGAPRIGQAEIAAVTECLRSGWIGTGARVRRFEEQFAAYKGAPYAAAVSSGTAALFLALTALGIGRDDEVIAPSMTFCSTVHAIVHTGATPVLVDCDRQTFNIDPAAVEQAITPRTRAVVVVHVSGRCCDMDAILDIARRHGLLVVEDCAHAIESSYRGRPAGLMGAVGCFSFYSTKNITTGDGGMVVTESRRLFKRIKALSLHGMIGDAWDRWVGKRTRYEVVAAGFKCNMTDIDAALGLAQFAEIEDRWCTRQRLWRLYDELLKGLPIVPPRPPEPETRHAYHLYTPLLDLDLCGATRRDLLAAMKAENIGVGVHYVPVHQLVYYRRRFRFKAADFPNASYVGERTFSLPLSACHSEADVRDVCIALRRIFDYYGRAHHENGHTRITREPVADWVGQPAPEGCDPARLASSSAPGWDLRDEG